MVRSAGGGLAGASLLAGAGGVSFLAAVGCGSGAGAVAVDGTSGVCAFAAAAGDGAGVLATALSSLLGGCSTLVVEVIIAPPPNPTTMAANTVPTPAKKEVMLKAMCVLHLCEPTQIASPRSRWRALSPGNEYQSPPLVIENIREITS
jgi:hypothetical protein